MTGHTPFHPTSPSHAPPYHYCHHHPLQYHTTQHHPPETTPPTTNPPTTIPSHPIPPPPIQSHHHPPHTTASHSKTICASTAQSTLTPLTQSKHLTSPPSIPPDTTPTPPPTLGHFSYQECALFHALRH